MSRQRGRSERVAVIGAGPAGLSTAYYLKQQGYRDVTVFEKLGRVGGLCRSVTEGYRSFDLGGNYVTPDYRETLELARHVGAKPIKAHEYLGARDVDGEIEYLSMFDWLRQDPDAPGRKLGHLQLVWLVLRYGWLRFKVRKVIDRPTMTAVEDHPALCVTFADWLDDNGLAKLRRFFEVPITMMGYGFLDQLAAPYALKYISLGTYRAMVMRGIPVLGRLARWPKRFEHGFQRMWELLSWELNVRLDVNITEIIRTGDEDRPICLLFEHHEQVDNAQLPRKGELWFDRLILACPLTPEVLGGMLELSEEEEALFGMVKTYSFCQLSLECEDSDGAAFMLEAPVVCVLPFTRRTIGRPWAIAQYWRDESPMLQLYARISREDASEIDRDDVIKTAIELLGLMGAWPVGSYDQKDARWVFYTRWPYFGHVDAEEIAAGFFSRLDRLQGEQNTYYVGGVTNFELIEPIVRHSKHIVDEHFGGA